MLSEILSDCQRSGLVKKLRYDAVYTPAIASIGPVSRAYLNGYSHLRL